MSCSTHFTLNGWDAVCTGRSFDNITSDTRRVSCSHCSRAVERMNKAKTQPEKWKRLDSGRKSRIGARILEQQLEAGMTIALLLACIPSAHALPSPAPLVTKTPQNVISEAPKQHPEVINPGVLLMKKEAKRRADEARRTRAKAVGPN